MLHGFPAAGSLALLLSYPVMGQTEKWIGVVQEVEGRWNLLDNNGARIGEVKSYLAVPIGASVKIAEQPGLASGRLKIALKDGSSFSRCCSASCNRRDNDCGERIEVTYRREQREPWANVFEQIGVLLNRAPELFPVPVISGRGIGGVPLKKQLFLADGVFVAAAESLDADVVVRRTVDAPKDQVYWVEVTTLKDGKPFGGSRRRRLGGAPESLIDLEPGLHQFSVLTGVTEPEDSGLNIWTLVVRSAEDPAISSYASVVKATETLDSDLAGALRRAYLAVLSRDSRP